jgi:hypothetical protein
VVVDTVVVEVMLGVSVDCIKDGATVDVSFWYFDGSSVGGTTSVEEVQFGSV